MSVDILANIGKETVSKKSTLATSKSEVPEKKEGGSLFDSLMKDIQHEKKIPTSKTKQDGVKEVSKENKTISSSTITATKSKGETTEASKKVSQELVDLVVDKVKKRSEKEVSLSKDSNSIEKTTKTVEDKDSNSIEKITKTVENKDSNSIEKTTKTNNSIKLNIETSTTKIKDAVKDIKQEVAKIGLEKSQKITKKDIDTSEQIKKSIIDIDEKDTKKNTLKQIVSKNTTKIKDAAEDINIEVSKVTKKIDLKVVENQDDTKKSIQKKAQFKDIDEITTKITTNTTKIKDAADDIKEEVSKIDLVEIQENSDVDQESKKNISISVKTVTDIEQNEEKIPKKQIVTTKQEIKVKIDKSVTKIEDATQKIDQEIVKLQNYKENGIFEPNTKAVVAEFPKKDADKHLLIEQDFITDEKTEDTKKVDSKTTLLANGFLNNQQKNKQTVSLTQVSNAKENIEKNKSLKSIKDSATMLDLNIEKVAVEHSDQSGKVEKLDILSKQDKDSQLQMFQTRGLNRFLIEKDNFVNNEQHAKTKELEKAVSADSQKQKEKNIILNVPQTVVETIETKIIGAQQKVGNFMSEVARNMYLNYKPPFTSFRMNLNPANLGSIAVIMRASKTDNNVSVSMNMNNNSTMDIFTDNKIALQVALQKQLGESSTVTLNFNTQNSNSQEQFGQSSQNNNSNGQNNTNTNTSEEPTDLNIEEENTEELDYM